jgi:Aspartyl protease
MRTRLVLISALLLPCLGVLADQKSPSAEFPFEYNEGMIWITVQTGKSPRPLNFLLDSGAGASVLNLSTMQRLGLPLGNRIEVQGVDSTATGYFPQRLTALASGVPLPKQYIAVDLDKLSDACHCEVDGLIGADFFHERVVQIDFAAHKIRILARSSPLATDDILPLKQNRRALLAPVTVNGKEKQWVRVDTGCASALQWVNTGTPAENRSHRIAVALKEISVDLIPVTVRIGNTQISSVSAELHKRPIFTGENGLLGNGLLSRFSSVTIDAKAGRLILQPRTATP